MPPTVRDSRAVADTGQKAAGDPFAEIVALAQSSPSRSRLLTQALASIVRAFGSPYGAIHVRYASEVIQDEAHSGPTDPRFWKESLQHFLTEALTGCRSQARLLKSKRGNAKVAFLAAPLFESSGPAVGAIALVVHASKDDEWTGKLASLEALCRLASFCTEFVGRSAARETGSAGGTGLEQMLSRAGACDSVEEFAFAVTNELRNRLGFAQASLATVEGKSVRIRSISGLDQVNKRSPGVAHLRHAMEECLDMGELIVSQQGERWAGNGKSDARTGGDYKLHTRWRMACGGDAVASIPLRMNERIVAVLSLRRAADEPFTRPKLEELAQKLRPIVPALFLLRGSGRTLFRHAVDSTRAVFAALASPGHWAGKCAALTCLAGLAYFSFGTMNYAVHVPCTVAPATVRHLSTPMDGVLASAHAVEGDAVRQGDVLAELDKRGLEQQRRVLQAESEVLEREKDRAMAESSPAEHRLAEAQQQLVAAKLAIIDRQIESCTLRAPFDGIVVRGDLRERIGQELKKGEPLFEVAAGGAWKLKLDVPESQIEPVSADLSGFFASFADPNRAIPFRIERVSASAELRQDGSVFVAEAAPTSQAKLLLPGMEGIARIEAGRRPVRWVLLHPITDYLRLHFWL